MTRLNRRTVGPIVLVVVGRVSRLLSRAALWDPHQYRLFPVAVGSAASHRSRPDACHPHGRHRPFRGRVRHPRRRRPPLCSWIRSMEAACHWRLQRASAPRSRSVLSTGFSSFATTCRRSSRRLGMTFFLAGINLYLRPVPGGHIARSFQDAAATRWGVYPGDCGRNADPPFPHRRLYRPVTIRP